MLLEFLVFMRDTYGPDWSCDIVVRRGGALLADFQKVGRVVCLEPSWMVHGGLFAAAWRRVRRWGGWERKAFRRFVVAWKQGGDGIILSNTGTNGDLLAVLPEDTGPVISWVHELYVDLRRLSREIWLESTLQRTHEFWAVSVPVADDLRALGVPDDRIRIAPNVVTAVFEENALQKLASRTRTSLGLTAECKLVVGCGNRTSLKGLHLFVGVAERAKLDAAGGLVFIWVGGGGYWLDRWRMRQPSKRGLVQYVGEVDNVAPFLAAADLVLVTSRRESFSRVVLEAGSMGKAVLAYRQARGPVALLEDCQLVEPVAVGPMAVRVQELLKDPAERNRLGAALSRRVLADFIASQRLPDLRTWAESLSVQYKRGAENE